MAETTKIEWCDATFNPWIGCTKVHAGCTNCYAERYFDKRRHFAKWGPNGTRVLTSEANWRKPETWNRKAEKEGRRMRVFCASLADVFEDWPGEITDSNGNRMMACRACRHVDLVEAGHGFWEAGIDGYNCPVCEHTADLDAATLDDVRRRLFALIDATPWLDWLLVTKRPENVTRMWCSHVNTDGRPPSKLHRPNVWILTSVSDQATSDKMVPELLKLRDLVPVLGLSIEPLLGPIELDYALSTGDRFVDKHFGWLDVLDWIIVGGESGPNARPMHPDWVRSLRDQATAAGVAFHYKQWGEWLPQCNDPFQPSPYKFVHVDGRTFDRLPEHVTAREISGVGWVGKAAAGRLLDGRTWDEFPTVTKG